MSENRLCTECKNRDRSAFKNPCEACLKDNLADRPKWRARTPLQLWRDKRRQLKAWKKKRRK